MNTGLLPVLYSKRYPDFITVTGLEWKSILESDSNKDEIIESMRFLTKEGRITIYGFVIMSNHFHLLWQIMGDHERENVQRDFLKYTSQRILMNFRNIQSPLLPELLVNAKDRKYQVWERRSLSIPIWTRSVLIQKLNYIHSNPVKANLCRYPEEYRYSSARFYDCNERTWDFLVHYDG